MSEWSGQARASDTRAEKSELWIGHTHLRINLCLSSSFLLTWPISPAWAEAGGPRGSRHGPLSPGGAVLLGATLTQLWERPRGQALACSSWGPGVSEADPRRRPATGQGTAVTASVPVASDSSQSRAPVWEHTWGQVPHGCCGRSSRCCALGSGSTAHCRKRVLQLSTRVPRCLAL